MKKKKYKMKRKTKAIIGIIVCLVLAASNIFLSNYTWTKQTALEELMDYHTTGDVDIVAELPELLIKNKAGYRFYLVENDDCFAMFSINRNFWYGWLDGPCLIIEKDENAPIQVTYNSFTSAQDEDKEMLRVFGLINDVDISRIEVEIYFATTGTDQTLEKLTLKTDKFIECEAQRYFNIDHIYVDKLSEFLMPPFTVNGYNEDGELIYSEEFSYGQSTSIG